MCLLGSEAGYVTSEVTHAHMVCGTAWHCLTWLVCGLKLQWCPLTRRGVWFRVPDVCLPSLCLKVCLGCMSHDLKIERSWCNSPRKWCNVKNVWQTFLDPINREPSPHSLQLPGNFRMDYNSMDYRMESHYVCCVCDTSFSAHENKTWKVKHKSVTNLWNKAN